MNAIEPKAGDLLLMMSTGELSKLIAWFADSPYSHSALMVSEGVLMEAIADGITETKLVDLKRPDFKIKYVDVFRLHDADGHPFKQSQLLAILNSAHRFIGVPFEFGLLVQISVLCAVRQKIPSNPMVRRLIRLAFDFVLSNSEKAMTCSQFVYTSLLQADVAPNARVTPRIIHSPAANIAFPDDIDWPALMMEIKHLFPADQQQTTLNYLMNEFQGDEISIFSESDLLQMAAEVRTVLGFTQADEMKLAMSVIGEVIEKPNPKLITSGDLLASPDHVALGRWFSMN